MENNRQGQDISLAELPRSVSDHHLVYIWMSIGAQQFGHASLLLSNGVYISWWPKGRKMKCGPLSKEGNCSTDLKEDIEKEQFEPDYTFSIPSSNLDINRMTQYWNGWLKRGHYALLNRNCCSMVYRVLSKGGAPRSATVVWRPETLRRYVVIYLGGGSQTQLFWNWPRSDELYKGNHTLYIWKETENNKGHASLKLEDNFYISWWPLIQKEVDDETISEWIDIQHGRPSTSMEEDTERMGRGEDFVHTFSPKYLDLSEMKRRWKKFLKEDQKELWGANSFWLMYQILTAGGAPILNRPYDYWCGDNLLAFVNSKFPPV